MNDWREDGQAAHELELLQQQWLTDPVAQAEYQEFLDQRKQEELENEMG